MSSLKNSQRRAMATSTRVARVYGQGIGALGLGRQRSSPWCRASRTFAWNPANTARHDDAWRGKMHGTGAMKSHPACTGQRTGARSRIVAMTSHRKSPGQADGLTPFAVGRSRRDRRVDFTRGDEIASASVHNRARPRATSRRVDFAGRRAPGTGAGLSARRARGRGVGAPGASLRRRRCARRRWPAGWRRRVRPVLRARPPAREGRGG